MFFKTIFLCLVGLVLVKSAEQNPLEITFQITSKESETKTNIICDHNIDHAKKKMYTVREGEELTIITKYNSYINHFFCHAINNQNEYFEETKNKNFVGKKVTTFKVTKRMGTIWNCTMLAHREAVGILPVVYYKDANYAAAYCYMNIHVRQTNSPQTILVNNMVLQAVRTDLSEKDVDFTAEYRYADGDVINVTCINFSEPAPLTMEYAMAGTMSDNSTMKELSSDKAIGFRVKLHSGHNNSFMICTNKESIDYTKVKVIFIQEEFKNVVRITINGMTLRPKLKHVDNNLYGIEYKYQDNEDIKVVCEVQGTDMELVVVDPNDFAYGKVSSYKRTEIVKNKNIEMLFPLAPNDDKKLRCAADDSTGSKEQVEIRFTAGNFPIDQFPLYMELSSNGAVMELYNDDKLNVMYYEFKDGETLRLTCGPIPAFRGPGPVLHLQIKHSNNKMDSDTVGCVVSQEIVTRREYDNTPIVCYLKEPKEVYGQKYKVIREIRVILRARVLTTTSTK